MARPTNVKIDFQTGSTNTLYATWNWSKSHTENYSVRWCYSTGDGIAFVGSDTTTAFRQSTYTIPDNARIISFKVKPISKKHRVNNKDVSYWTADWSTVKYYNVSSNPPVTPPTPSIDITNLKLKTELNNINDLNATYIEFQIVKNDKSVFKTGKSAIKTYHAAYSCTVTAGSVYKVRCRSIRGKEKSSWSAFSSNEGTIPATPSKIVKIAAISETSVFIDWANVSNATSYVVQWTTQKRYFDSSNEVQSMTIDAKVAGHAEVTGLETGDEYFFRVKATNENGDSGWSEIKSVKIGKAPAAPTTWSSSTTVITGEPLTLYWTHNSEDGSYQTYADIEMYVNGVKESHTIRDDASDEKNENSFVIDTSSYVEGTTILWRVRTAGVTTTYGEWSVQRTVDIYAPPTLEISVTDSKGGALETVTSFPIYISGITGPETQSPIGYHVAVIANETYETIDNIGNTIIISSGSEVYSKYFDTSEQLLVELSAGNIDLENNISYSVVCTASMNSGLSTEASCDFTVSWTDVEYEPDAEIAIDEDVLSAHIRPYCEFYPVTYYKVTFASDQYTTTTETITAVEGTAIDNVTTTTGEQVYSYTDSTGTVNYYCMVISEEPQLVEGVTLSVYRREFDGTFTELETGIDNLSNTFITDPHPSLDYARYRVVAITNSTGAVSYYDVPGYPVGEKAAVIQWDEDWSTFDTTNEDALEQPEWAGSMLKLPYNIDVSDSYKADVSLVEYIGRKHPVTYYGTQTGETSSWSMEIDKEDEETLYALRRLAIWMGDVYVREPSGSGYWANVSVSFSQTHCELTIPVNLNITRVAGGA